MAARTRTTESCVLLEIILSAAEILDSKFHALVVLLLRLRRKCLIAKNKHLILPFNLSKRAIKIAI
jgi:hypothetical protein